MEGNYYKKIEEQLDGFRLRIQTLKQRREEPSMSDVELLEQAFQELNVTMEELQVAEEELHQQNDELVEAQVIIDNERQHYQDLFQSAPDGYLVTNVAGHILEVNHAAEMLINSSSEVLLDKPLIVFISQGDRVLFRQRLDSAARLKKIENWEVKLKPTNRTYIDASITFVILNGWRNSQQNILWIIRDITERKTAQQALKHSEERFRRIFQNAEIGIALVDEKAHLAEINPALKKMLWYGQDELKGAPLKHIFNPEHAKRNVDLVRQVLDGDLRHYTQETELTSKDGRSVWVTLAVSQYEWHETGSPYAILMVENKTQEKKLRDELEEMRKKIIIGNEFERQRLSEHLHDGPLQDLYGVFYQLNMLMPEIEQPNVKKQLDSARGMLLSILNDLRMVSYELRPPALSHYGLAKAILSYTERFKQRYTQFDIRLLMDNDEKKLPNDYRLALFRNFQQAMNNIARHSNAKNIWVGLDVKKDEVMLEVKDDGQGFTPPPSWIDQAREGHLGLASCAERSEALGGRIEITSEPGKGTIFRTILPIHKEKPVRAEQPDQG